MGVIEWLMRAAKILMHIGEVVVISYASNSIMHCIGGALL
jgi:hypothetical protein